MRTASYQKSAEKVYKKLKYALWRKNFVVTDEDIKNSIIRAKRDKSFFKAGILLEITFKKLDEESAQVIIHAESEKNWFN